MNPAYSVILFTTASGAGYGLLAWLAALVLFGSVAPDGAVAATGLILALALISIGLLSSTLHLGRPERAWRALSQWQTSWLSREGALALATYVPAGLWLLAALAPGSVHWLLLVLLALLAAAGAMATVWCTGMIYQSLPTIRAWSEPMVAPVYVLLALASGSMLVALVLALVNGRVGAGVAWLAALLLLAGAAAKWLYWRRIDEAPRNLTAGDATGLGALGQVRVVEAAHSRPNFVMREMGYRVARRHASRLRYLALGAGFLAPAALLVIAAGGSGAVAFLGMVVAALGVAMGVVVERWLFFAEAEHVVGLFYGADRA